MLHLRNKDRKALCQIAEQCFTAPIEIWAYGSRVNGDSHDASDLNLVIRRANLTAVDWQELMNFKEKLQHSNIPILIQSFDWNSLPESFHRNILKNYVVIFSRLK